MLCLGLCNIDNELANSLECIRLICTIKKTQLVVVSFEKQLFHEKLAFTIITVAQNTRTKDNTD